MAVAQRKPSAAPLKDLYDIGEVPPLGHVHGRFFAVSPKVTTTLSQGTPRSSADTRWQSLTDPVP